MPAPRSFRSIIELWPSDAALASELNDSLKLGNDALTGAAVEKWRQRDSIPAVWWSAILDRPRVKKAGVTASLMASLAARARHGSAARAAR